MTSVEDNVTMLTTPLPVRLIACGLPAALSLIVMLPVLVPAALGVKRTVITQLPLVGKVFGLIGQLLLCE
jgi:hypothetical protein